DAVEWSDSAAAARVGLVCTLAGVAPGGPATLLLKQDGVKRNDWTVTLNGQALGKLQADEHRVIQTFEIPAGLLRAENEVRVEADASKESADDIVVGGVRLVPQALDAWLAAGRVT